jgi:hypothetical protein
MIEGSGSRRPKNKWIRWILIRNTGHQGQGDLTYVFRNKYLFYDPISSALTFIRAIGQILVCVTLRE